jgi:hypothetical protein
VASNLDRQSKALYAFTVTTIIFLPLSFVTSFLGMNTFDVRNMGSSQWIFWAAGVPFTVLILVILLIATGEIGAVRKWIYGFIPKKKEVLYIRSLGGQ